MKRKLILITCLVVTISVLSFLFFNNFIIAEKCSVQGNIGIIDTYITQKYDNVIYKTNQYVPEIVSKTHGDEMINFTKILGFTGDIYYYAAINENGAVTTKKIIDGLDWMVENNINRVNISLSSKFYNKELDNWIHTHKQIKVFCSYNNYFNSVTDYPAMYSDTFGSGSDKRINYKVTDKHYVSNNIIVINNGVNIFKGNSYLSMYTLLLDRKE